MFFHLARHVQHGSLQIPRHVVILRPRGSQKPATSESNKRNSPVTAEELYRLALTICDTAITATSQFPGRCTFLEGYAGPLALRCAILSALARHQVRSVRFTTCVVCVKLGVPPECTWCSPILAIVITHCARAYATWAYTTEGICLRFPFSPHVCAACPWMSGALMPWAHTACEHSIASCRQQWRPSADRALQHMCKQSHLQKALFAATSTNLVWHHPHHSTGISCGTPRSVVHPNINTPNCTGEGALP